ncbi:TorD/DmsD family molecular chaperone [Limibacillus halophilus]|uniref:TorA maturation chaperone TorD n=1 Tax=Limibacillus halophilus TaxID=1579333 RepID=A0A839SUM0_9PROT|nr:molecular chaperone TorD family protein [Limibacillus halophilus]MBB3064685.1 TorA maturation chaperone TorD [Limibacillus halophilus]
MTEPSSAIDIAEEDELRANLYVLLGRMLASAPDSETLEMVAGLKGDDSELGQAISVLASAARNCNPKMLEREYFDLFIGIGHGELTPYGSYYLTGFLNEKPLANLREDMGRLGVARVKGVHEPEDHIAALCEMMAGLIGGAFGEPLPLDEQRAFFDRHIGCWAPRFFQDLQAARAASFYMPVGKIGQIFMEIESEAFAMAA